MNNPMECRFIDPKNYGWIELPLNEGCVEYIWKCVDEGVKRNVNAKGTLIGQIDKAYAIEDTDGLLMSQVLRPLAKEYAYRWGDKHTRMPCKRDYDFVLDGFWVNYQNQHEYQPIHDHGGVYSFAAWLKIPTHFEDQALLDNSKDAGSSWNSSFIFQYTSTFGDHETYMYKLDPSWENTLLFFPSKLKHAVYPYFQCDEQRISISGNLWLQPKHENEQSN